MRCEVTYGLILKPYSLLDGKDTKIIIAHNMIYLGCYHEKMNKSNQI